MRRVRALRRAVEGVTEEGKKEAAAAAAATTAAATGRSTALVGGGDGRGGACGALTCADDWSSSDGEGSLSGVGKSLVGEAPIKEKNTGGAAAGFGFGGCFAFVFGISKEERRRRERRPNARRENKERRERLQGRGVRLQPREGLRGVEAPAHRRILRDPPCCSCPRWLLSFPSRCGGPSRRFNARDPALSAEPEMPHVTGERSDVYERLREEARVYRVSHRTDTRTRRGPRICSERSSAARSRQPRGAALFVTLETNAGDGDVRSRRSSSSACCGDGTTRLARTRPRWRAEGSTSSSSPFG